MTSTDGTYASDFAGRRIREARTRRGWNLAELAGRCAALGATHLTRAVVGDIERRPRNARYPHGRQITVEELLIFAAALAVPPAWLIAPLGRGDVLAIGDGASKGPATALPWLTGDAETPAANWEPAAPGEDLDSWRQAHAELLLVQSYLQQLRTIWVLLNSRGDQASSMAVAARHARELATLLVAQGIEPPAAPPAVIEAMATARFPLS